MSERTKRDSKSRRKVTLDKDIVQGSEAVQAGKPVELYPDQIENLKQQGVASSPAGKEG